MVLKIAWKNIWRHKVRSFVVITAIALGLLAGLFASSIVSGMMLQRFDTIVKREMSHLQFHNPGFRDEMLISQFMSNGQMILDDVATDERVEAYSGRVLSTSMFASANLSGAMRVNGVDPENEQGTTALADRLVDGKYFEGVKRNPILVSEATAEEYKLKVRSKVVLTMQDVNGEMVAGAFRVVGIFDSNNNMVDKVNVYVRKTDLAKLIKMDANGLHEVAVLLKDEHHESAEAVAGEYQTKYEDHEVLPWLDLSSGMRLMTEIGDTYTLVLVGIILLALMFSIINTMLMAVLERIKEIGMLMAVGMSKPKVFGMIMFETVFLTMVGAPIGLFLSWVLITYFGNVGIDLSAANYEDFGFSSMMYPNLDLGSYIKVTIMVIVMAIIAAIYPARKALKLNPVEAIRKI